MLLEKLGVLIYHFRLEPETELHAHLIKLVGNTLKSALKLLLIDEPVTETGVIVITLSEPSVIQNHHFDSKLFCATCNIKYLFTGEIEIGCLPVIDKNRTSHVKVLPVADILTDYVVVIVA